MTGNPLSSPDQSQRKRDLLRYYEADNGAQDQPIWLNRRYRESDRKFMQFLIPSGKTGAGVRLRLR
jgi:hypothetical protein